MGSAFGKLLQLRCVWTLWRSSSCGCTWYCIEDDLINTLGRYISVSQGTCATAFLSPWYISFSDSINRFLIFIKRIEIVWLSHHMIFFTLQPQIIQCTLLISNLYCPSFILQLTKAYFGFVEVLCGSHITFILKLDTATFMHLVGSLESGLKGLDTSISSQVRTL